MKRLAIALVVLTGIAAVLAVTYGSLLEAAGRFLIVQDPLEKADALVVLSGGRSDERVRQAADLYREGVAPLVVLSAPSSEATLGIPFSEVLRGQALRNGIPESALLFETTATSTAEEARNLRPILEGQGVRRAIVVTSSYHSRRTRYLFRRVFAGSSVEIRSYPVQRDLFSPVQWWTRDWDTEVVVLEYIKLGLTVLRYR